jgi:hypothetical protein
MRRPRLGRTSRWVGARGYSEQWDMHVSLLIRILPWLGCSSCMVGPAVRIAAGARVKDAILMEGAFVDVSQACYLVISVTSLQAPADHFEFSTGSETCLRTKRHRRQGLQDWTVEPNRRGTRGYGWGRQEVGYHHLG